MRAMVTPQFGGPDLFEERDVERPQPGPGEVLVRVFAAGTNPVDAKLRAAGSSAGLEAPIILGADISGVVEEVGPAVTAFASTQPRADRQLETARDEFSPQVPIIGFKEVWHGHPDPDVDIAVSPIRSLIDIRLEAGDPATIGDRVTKLFSAWLDA